MRFVCRVCREVMMQFSKEPMEQFLHAHALKSKNDGFQWVWTFRPDGSDTWSTEIFDKVIRYLRTDNPSKERIVQESLQVTPLDGGAVLTITGLPQIASYCYTESVGQVTPRSAYQWNRRIVHVSESFPDEFPISMLSQVIEEQKMEDNHVRDDWENVPKHYRMVKEFCYEYTDVMYCVRMVRESSDMTPTMKESDVSRAPVKYEIDMKCLQVDENMITDLVQHAVRLMQVIMEQSYLLSKAQMDEVLEGYDSLVNSVVRTFTRGRDRREGTEADKMAVTHHFLAPKPITLERQHVIEPGPETYGIHSIWKGYAVTDKADGERMLAYIAKDGHMYFINNVFEVVDTGFICKTGHLTHSLLDGEYIAASLRTDGDAKDIFAVFDVYFVNGKSVMDLPLVRAAASSQASSSGLKSRYGWAREICNPKLWETKKSTLEMRCKEHVFAEADKMKDVCKAILMTNHLPYHIDGLVFTPSDLGVFGYYPGKPATVTENVKWDRVLKWKPSEQNTIDFMVEQGEDIMDPVTKKMYREFKLYTGYNAQQWEPISADEGVRLRYDRSYAKTRRMAESVYRAKLFEPISYYENGVHTALVAMNDKGECVCDDGSILANKTIVEFAYTPKSLGAEASHISKRWKPLRVREDKTRIYQKTQKLSKTANDLSVASSIWRSIHNPVTMDMIVGAKDVPLSAAPDTLEERLLGTDDVYYARDIPRQHMLSVHMLNFHNQGVKKMLYQYSHRRDSLLELACGMAGDLPRWRDGSYRFVLGVDLVKDNITNPREGAYARTLRFDNAIKIVEQGMERRLYQDIVFAVGDCAKPFENGKAAEGIDGESKKLLKILYGTDSPDTPYYHYIKGRAARKFNVVSCMFAVHYFFQNEEKLKGFLHNVAYNLKRNGIFIATFMDGDKVHELLENSHQGVAEGRKLNDEIPVWAILKRYTEYNEDTRFGSHVDVFLENTNRLIPEFLVHFPTLVSKAAEFGLELVETGMFSDTFAKLKQQITAEPRQRDRLSEDILALDKDPIQTRFSFLNRWVVFRQTRDAM